MRSIKSMIFYLLLFAIGMVTVFIPFIDLMGTRTLWIKQTNLNYFLDACLFICGSYTAYFSLKQLDK